MLSHSGSCSFFPGRNGWTQTSGLAVRFNESMDWASESLWEAGAAVSRTKSDHKAASTGLTCPPNCWHWLGGRDTSAVHQQIQTHGPHESVAPKREATNWLRETTPGFLCFRAHRCGEIASQRSGLGYGCSGRRDEREEQVLWRVGRRGSVGAGRENDGSL